MDAATARATVLAHLSELAPESASLHLADDEDLRAALDLDSMDFLQLVTRVGQAAGRDIPDADATGLRSLTDWVAYLTTPAPAAAAPPGR